MQSKGNVQWPFSGHFIQYIQIKYHFPTGHTETMAAEKKDTKVNKATEVYNLFLFIFISECYWSALVIFC